MRKVASKKLIALLIGAFAVGAGGTILYKSQTSDMSKDNNTQPQQEESTEDSTISGDETKTDQGTSGTQGEQNTSSEQPKAPTPARPPTSGTSGLASLGTSVTAQKAGSNIEVSFYLEDSGTFTIQEKSGSSWKTTTENIFYPGRGGLTAATLSSGQSSKTIRVLKSQNGKYVSVTKSFTITRSAVESAGGIKTYR